MKNKQSGFLKLIIFLIIAFFVLSYFDIGIREAIDWIINLIKSIF